MESLLTLIVLLLIGAFVGVGILVAILYMSWDKD
jgi:hypothetical protein